MTSEDPINSDGAYVSGLSPEARLRTAQITQIFNLSAMGGFGSFIGVIVLGIALWPVKPHSQLIMWVTIFFVLYCIRTCLTIGFQKVSPTGSDIFWWGRMHQLLTLSSGIAWGYAAIFLFPEKHPYLQIFMIIFIGGIVAGGIAVYAPTNEYLQNIAVALVPLTGQFFYQGGTENFVIAGLLLMFGVVMALSGRTIHRSYAELLTLRFERLDLIDDLKTEIEWRKNVEKDLVKSRNELEYRVGQRTAEITKINNELYLEIGERLNIEHELRKRKEEIEAILNSTSDSAFLIDPQGVFLALNKTTARALGRSTTELIGETIFDYLPPELVTSGRRRLDEVVKTGQIVSFEDQQNEKIFFHNLFPVFDEDGQVRRVAIFVRDITKNRRLEQSLRDSEEKYRLLVEKTFEGIVVIQDGLVRFVNRATLDIGGYEQSDIIGKPFTEFVFHEDLHESGQRYNMIVNSSKQVPRHHLRLIRKDGEIIWVEADSGPFAWEGENALLVVMIDITEGKKDQEKLRESERKFKLLLEDVGSVPVQGYNVHREVVFWNTASEKLYGYSREEAMGKKLENLIIPSDLREIVISGIDDWVQRGQKIEPSELTLVRKDGAPVAVYSTHVMLEETGGDKEMYCVDLDLSELKKAEAERSSLREQLFQSQKMEAIGKLVAGIAHDFNNLLQVVIGFSQLLLQQKKDEDHHYVYVEKIYQAGKRGADLVKNLMAFSRQTPVALRPIDLNSELEQIYDLLSQTITKNIEILLELSRPLKPIMADPSQLCQIIMNLAVNGRDAMPNGGKLVMKTSNLILEDVDCLSQPKLTPGTYVSLSVSDTGHGIDEKDVDHIFEPFYTTKEPGKGSGLGLATVYGIVHQNNGHISLESRTGVGTTFRILFPAIIDEEDFSKSEIKMLPTAGVETILLVDDDSSILLLGKDILEAQGYEVITATDGAKAMEIYQRAYDKISLVILDMMMPEMGGSECLKGMVRINPDARILIASACAENESTAEDLLNKAKGFVSKPYDIQDLLHSIRKILEM